MTGRFSFYLTASNSLSSPPAPPSGGGGGSFPSPPSPDAAFSASGGLDGSETIQVPVPPLPPGLATNDEPHFFTIKRPLFSASASGSGAIALASPNGVQPDDGSLNPPAPAQPEATPQPSRPDTRPRKDLSGTIDLLALQNYGSANNRPDNGVAGNVVIDLALPLPLLAPWPKFICNSFEITMKAGGFLTNFYYTDGQVTADQLEGGNNIFNSGVDFGLIVSHGAKAINNSVDFHFPTPTLETYIPLPVTNGKYPWIPLSSMKFGRDRLKWMGIYACNLLYADNYDNMLAHNELPISAKLHMFISGSTTIYGNGAFGATLGRDLTGNGETNSTPMSVFNSWIDAAQQTHKIANASKTITSVCKMRFLYWDPCLDDTIYSYAAIPVEAATKWSQTNSKSTFLLRNERSKMRRKCWIFILITYCANSLSAQDMPERVYAIRSKGSRNPMEHPGTANEHTSKSFPGLFVIHLTPQWLRIFWNGVVYLSRTSDRRATPNLTCFFFNQKSIL